MTLSILLALVGALAGFGAAIAFVVRYAYGTSDASLSALAQSGSCPLTEIEPRARDGARDASAADEARIALLPELLVTNRAERQQSWHLGGDRGSLVIISLGTIAVGCFALLIAAGERSALPGYTRAASSLQQDPDLARLERYASAVTPNLPASPIASRKQAQALPDVATMTERLAARLQSTPEDADGWRMLGWSYLHMQQASKAAEAYARAVGLRPESSELWCAYGEALVAAESGTVTPKAIEMFSAALKIDAQYPKARYFVALAKAQNGDKKEALRELLALQSGPLEDEPWVAQLRERAQALTHELNPNVSERVPAPDDLPKTEAASREPPSEDVGRARSLPGDGQLDLVRAMVDGLAERLQKAPRDEDGWLRLIRSRVVLGEALAARDALTRALAVFSDDASAEARISAAAKALGVTVN
jgi:cytochrome c-type biogenesis protein CcmH